MGRCLWLYLFLASYLALISANKVADAFRKNKLVPHIIHSAPGLKAKVEYSSEAKANLGNVLKQEDTERFPNVSWDADPTAYYTLIMFDPDEKCGTFLHWLVSNIPGDQVSSGDQHAVYLHPNPSLREPHRYVQLVYKQRKMKLGAFFRENDSRIHFSLAAYIKTHKLIGPVAGNFYVVE